MTRRAGRKNRRTLLPAANKFSIVQTHWDQWANIIGRDAVELARVADRQEGAEQVWLERRRPDPGEKFALKRALSILLPGSLAMTG